MRVTIINETKRAWLRNSYMRHAAALFLCLAVSTGAQSIIPSTPSGIVLRSWIEAFNSGDSAHLLAFWKKYGPDGAAERVAMDQRLRGMTGGLTPVQVVQDTGSRLVLISKEGSGRYAETTLDLASTNPPLIKNILSHPTAPPQITASPAANDREVAAQIESYIAHLTGNERFSGAILVAHDAKPVLDQAWGMADREKQIRNSIDTQFCLGSMNKMFTAVSVLQLVQEGKLSLDGTISDYWPDYPNHELAKRVKIRHLLSHTGGTGDIFTSEYDAHRLETRTLSDYVKLFGSRPLRFEPGSKWEYSNYGYILLGQIIEIVSGENYQDYVQKHVYAPAGMTHTDSRPEVNRVPGHAVGFTSGPDGLQPNTRTLPWSGTSAGGGYSTVGDLLLFADALQSGKLLSPDLVQLATTDQTHAGYGFGFNVLKDHVYGHGGGAPGVNAEMHVIPKKGYVIVVLANRDPFMATSMESFIEAILPAA